MEVALLEDEMVPFAGFVQLLFDAQGYLGASTPVKIYVVDADGSWQGHGTELSFSEDFAPAKSLASFSYSLCWGRPCRVPVTSVCIILCFSHPSPVVFRRRSPQPPLVTFEVGRLVNSSGTCRLLNASWLLHTGFSPGIARFVRVELPWEIGFAESVPYPGAHTSHGATSYCRSGAHACSSST
ncbi:hypothetical protein IFM61392_09591 [Aspergillus lentulus]|nr:hypothetical protein IFM61392_09591 [Aspergillus lentulus]